MNSKKTIFEYATPHVLKLSGYVPGFQPKEPGWIKLNTNENPYPPSPAVETALVKEIGESLRLYPDPLSMELREAVAELHGLNSGNVIIGNGSDDILNLLTRAFSRPGANVGYTVPSYSLYPVICGIQGAGMVEVAFDRSMELPIDELSKVDAKIIFFTSPNAPTGVAYSNEDLRRLLEAFDGIVVIDEAYADFAEENAVELLADYPNAVVTRTFSKSYSLAGMRIGYALAHSDVIDLVDRVRDSYNVDRLAQAAGIAAIKDQSYLKAVTGKVVFTRDYYLNEFEKLGWFAYDSKSNFIFVEPVNAAREKGAEVASDLFEFLKSNRILVRYFPRHALTESFLRISVGDEKEMLTLIETIQEWLKNA